jgi:predicted phosphoribosyltransferase
MLAADHGSEDRASFTVIVAVPTGMDRSVEIVAREVDEAVCLNIRGMPFAIADAYLNWYDIDEEEAVRVLRFGDRP